MSLSVDFTMIPRLAKGEFRLPAGDFLPTTPARSRGEASHPAAEADYVPSYRMPDCVSALCAAFTHPLGGMFAPGLAQ